MIRVFASSCSRTARPATAMEDATGRFKRSLWALVSPTAVMTRRCRMRSTMHTTTDTDVATIEALVTVLGGGTSFVEIDRTLAMRGCA